ncbi:hypothetical protein ES703_124390 [subsurface metagenome]
MKEEELIKKLENVELPRIELQSHRRWLRMALFNAGYLKRQQRASIWGLAKLKGVKDIVTRSLVLRQPVWQTAIVGVLAIALIAGLAIALPSLTRQSPEALAADIACNSPEVQAALGGEEVTVKVIKLVDDKGTVLCIGGLGTVTAEVDLDKKVVTEVVLMPELTGTDEQRAIDIARADPRVKELLDKGAMIGKVSPMYFFGTRMDVETGETREFSETLVRVEIEWIEKNYAAEVDLDAGKVIRLVEVISGEYYKVPSSTEGEWDIEYFHIEEGPVEEKVKP